MLAQTQEQKAKLSLDIEYLIHNDLKNDVTFYLKRYSTILELKLGMTEEDLVNDIREQVWKGLLTWRNDGKANRKTYISNLIEKRFITLLQKTGAKKNNIILYYADVFTTLQQKIDKEYLETQETGEEILKQRQEAMKDLESLSLVEKLIYPDLLIGRSIGEIMKQHRLDRVSVVKAITKINERVTERRRNTARGAL